VEMRGVPGATEIRGKTHADADVVVIVPNFRGRKWKLGRRPTIFRV